MNHENQTDPIPADIGVRYELDDDERMEESKTPVVKLFLGDVCGVRLVLSGVKSNEKHICFQILGEDDGYWFVRGDDHCISSYWIKDMHEVINAAYSWCVSECERDSDSYGRFAGYQLKLKDFEKIRDNNNKK